MSLLDKLAEMGKSAVTIDLQLKQLRDELDKTSQKVDGLVDALQEMRERITRLETQRESDRSQMQTEVERFKLEVERAQMRLPKQLPPSDENSN